MTPMWRVVKEGVGKVVVTDVVVMRAMVRFAVGSSRDSVNGAMF
jgi:hypothetical protein